MVVGGVGTIVLGSVFAGRSDASSSQLPQHCVSSNPDKCDATGYTLREQATRDERSATISLGVGAGAVFAGLVLAWINPGGTPFGAKAKLDVAPMVGAEMKGVSVVGTF